MIVDERPDEYGFDFFPSGDDTSAWDVLSVYEALVT